MIKYLLVSLILLTLPILPGPLAAGPKSTGTSGPLPGTLQPSGGGVKIYLEDSRLLLWPSGGSLSLQQPGAGPIALNLQAAPRTTHGAEALGLEVEEADLGGGGKSGRYLHHKKQPKGRSLDPKAVGEKPQDSDLGKTTQQTVQGISTSRTQYTNGATKMGWNWGKTQEEAFFDRRNTLISVELRRRAGDTEYRLKQWADGSFSRTYVRPQGEVEWTYDALGTSYRLRLANSQGQTVQELICDPKCSLED